MKKLDSTTVSLSPEREWVVRRDALNCGRRPTTQNDGIQKSCTECALQAMYRRMEEDIENLSQQVAEQAGQRSGARLLMTHPGVGPVTALAADVFLGDPRRFAHGKALTSYVGIIPREYSSGTHQRLGGVTKQGSPLLRSLWCEAGAHAARRDQELKRFYRRKLMEKGLGKARVAVARKLGIRLWIMLRTRSIIRLLSSRTEAAKRCSLCRDARNGK